MKTFIIAAVAAALSGVLGLALGLGFGYSIGVGAAHGPGPTNAKGASDGPAFSGKALADLVELFKAAGVKGRFYPRATNIGLPSGVKDAAVFFCDDERKPDFTLMKFESAAKAEEFARYKEIDEDKLYRNGEIVLQLASGSPQEQLILETFRKF